MASESSERDGSGGALSSALAMLVPTKRRSKAGRPFFIAQRTQSRPLQSVLDDPMNDSLRVASANFNKFC
jgi:hypothetical protein